MPYATMRCSQFTDDEMHFDNCMTPDDSVLPELTQRQEAILSSIVKAYTHSPEPVSSKYLVDRFNLPFSSATIRNEMMRLEELGYIQQPHTSAGRVPTATGYRYFVMHLVPERDSDALNSSDQRWIDDRVKQAPLASEQQMAQAANVLARVAQTAALVTSPRAATYRFKHLELIAIHGRLVLMVLVLQGGMVHQQMLTLAEPVGQARLSETADRLNTLLNNLTMSEARVRSASMTLLERDIADLVADAMQQSDARQSGQVFGDGLSEVVTLFPGSEGAQQAIRVIEERAILNMILDDVLTPMLNRVQVVIAGNGQWEELSRLSMVLSRYGIEGQVSGAVGVLGPTNINYERAIGVVGYVSGLMTDLLRQVYSTLPSGASPDEGSSGAAAKE
ncbi:MAG: heat-inducible transcription repressor HrcA [Anaerolineae bacterium]|nr:heat-inducible transcription repressor HrcA [Anaerolineae bacterium]